MAIIYKITNKINGKVYIGQTITPLNQRMSKHYSRANTEENPTGLHAAMKKYGRDNFDVEIVCECSTEELDDKERYYIEFYDSYNSGYNLTRGGQDGIGSRILFDKEKVIEAYNRHKTISDTAKELNCGYRTLSNYLKENNIPILYKPTGNLENLQKGVGNRFKEGDGVKSVRITDLNMEFPSLKDCAQWLIDNGYSKASCMDYARKGLSRALKGERKTYCGLHFEYLQ